MKNFLSISVSIFAIIASHNAQAAEIETHTTKGGWSYQYLEIPDATGFNITVAAPSNWHYNEKNPLIAGMGVELLLASGFGEMLPVDKAAEFETMSSNGTLIDDSDTLWAEIYVEKDELERAFPLFIGTINDPKFDADEFAKIKESNINYYVEDKSQSMGQAIELASREILGGGQYLNSGFLYNTTNANAVEIPAIENWYQSLSKLGSIKIGIAGEADPSVIEPYIDQLMAKFDPNALAQIKAEWEPNFSGRMILLKRTDIDKASIFLEAPWPQYKNGLDEEIGDMTAWIFGEGDQSRLFIKIRDELRASYGMSAGIENFDREHNGFVISGEIDSATQEKVMDMIKVLVDDVKANGITEAEFTQAKESLILNFELYMEDQSSVAFGLAHRQGTPYADESLTSEYESLKALTYEDANAAIKARFPSYDQFVKVIVSPNADGLSADCVLNAVEELAQCAK